MSIFQKKVCVVKEFQDIVRLPEDVQKHRHIVDATRDHEHYAELVHLFFVLEDDVVCRNDDDLDDTVAQALDKVLKIPNRKYVVILLIELMGLRIGEMMRKSMSWTAKSQWYPRRDSNPHTYQHLLYEPMKMNTRTKMAEYLCLVL